MIDLHPIFRLREKPSEGIIQLLESVTLGTDGAHYRHLDTRERIEHADNPLFLSMERNERVLGNITFCRRDDIWYIRYFAFNEAIQASGKVKSKNKNGLLRTELNRFFDLALNNQFDHPVRSFYAYIDPRNAKSLWMSENFGFEKIGEIATQTFSRLKPKKSSRVRKETNWNAIADLIRNTFGNQLYYFEEQTKVPPFYVLLDDKEEILACAKIHISNWAIERLPGRFGKWLVKLIPFVPFVRKLIQPNRFSFIVPEAVYVKDDNPDYLTELFEGILANENQKVIMWWVDKNDPTYSKMVDKVHWGLLHRILGVNSVNVVEKSLDKRKNSVPIYTSGFDFI